MLARFQELLGTSAQKAPHGTLGDSRGLEVGIGAAYNKTTDGSIVDWYIATLKLYELDTCLGALDEGLKDAVDGLKDVAGCVSTTEELMNGGNPLDMSGGESLTSLVMLADPVAVSSLGPTLSSFADGFALPEMSEANYRLACAGIAPEPFTQCVAAVPIVEILSLVLLESPTECAGVKAFIQGEIAGWMDTSDATAGSLGASDQVIGIDLADYASIISAVVPTITGQQVAPYVSNEVTSASLVKWLLLRAVSIDATCTAVETPLGAPAMEWWDPSAELKTALGLDTAAPAAAPTEAPTDVAPAAFTMPPTNAIFVTLETCIEDGCMAEMESCDADTACKPLLGTIPTKEELESTAFAALLSCVCACDTAAPLETLGLCTPSISAGAKPMLSYAADACWAVLVVGAMLKAR